MLHRSGLLALSLNALLLVSGCSASPDRSTLPEPVCTAGTRWSAGTQAFQETTSAWNLDGLGVAGARISAVDFDGDGWTDLFVHKIGNIADDFAPGGTRQTFLLRNAHGHFEDVTESSGLLVPRTSLASNLGRPIEVVAFADIDNDGDVDVYTGCNTSSQGCQGETSEILINDGAGHFDLGPADSDVRRAGSVDVPAGASFVDVDRDGNIDLWITEYSTDQGPLQDHLYRGDGTGRFHDITDEVGLTTKDWTDVAVIDAGEGHSRAWAAAACDLNGDGDAELMASSYGRAPNHLWQAQVSGQTLTYVNRSVASSYAFDGDQTWKDNQFARCYCQSNPDAEDCADVGKPQISCTQQNWNHSFDREPFRLGGNSATTVCADLNDDGNLDLVTSEIKHWWAGAGSDPAEILVNTGDPEVTFTRPGRASMGIDIPHAGTSWDEGIMTAAVLDFDNDGWPDLYWGASDYPGNRGILLHQDGPLTFSTVPVQDGIDHYRSHGVTAADFDHDGDLDVVVGHSLSRCEGTDECDPTAQVRMYQNVIGDGGNWIQLVLTGEQGSNRSAIGARVTVEAGGVTQTQEVDGGHGHYGAQSDMALHFGLGDACEAEVTIRWPDAELSTQHFHATAGHRLHVIQGQAPQAI